jgi:hypothetical protein
MRCHDGHDHNHHCHIQQIGAGNFLIHPNGSIELTKPGQLSPDLQLEAAWQFGAMPMSAGALHSAAQLQHAAVGNFHMGSATGHLHSGLYSNINSAGQMHASQMHLQDVQNHHTVRSLFIS